MTKQINSVKVDNWLLSDILQEYQRGLYSLPILVCVHTPSLYLHKRVELGRGKEGVAGGNKYNNVHVGRRERCDKT